MSAFDEREPFKKRIVSASLTVEQRAEFDAMKLALGIATDGALIKRALADLSRATLTKPADLSPSAAESVPDQPGSTGTGNQQDRTQEEK